MYEAIRLFVYIVSIGMAMYGLSCFNYDGIIRSQKIREFYVFYFMACIVLGYLFASFILSFVSIHL